MNQERISRGTSKLPRFRIAFTVAEWPDWFPMVVREAAYCSVAVTEWIAEYKRHGIDIQIESAEPVDEHN